MPVLITPALVTAPIESSGVTEKIRSGSSDRVPILSIPPILSWVVPLLSAVSRAMRVSSPLVTSTSTVCQSLIQRVALL